MPLFGRGSWAYFLLLVAVCWLIYGGNSGHRLLNWDDIIYVTDNPWVTHPSWISLREMFTQSRLSNWHPLTWLSSIPEYQLCGDKASCYKATNITLHAVNSFLVYGLCRLVMSVNAAKTTASGERIQVASVLAGLLFAVHPQHAESVIWVSERKDLLCALFYLLALICYLQQHITATPKRVYLPLLFFALAAMSKSMAVTLPAVLIILDFYPLQRFRHASLGAALRIAIVEKFHFHLTALALAFVTVLTQTIDATVQPDLLQRALTSTAALWHYVATFFWPWDLAPFYPLELVQRSLGAYPLAFVGGTALALLACAVLGGKRTIAALAYVLVTFAPVIGIVKIGDHAFADRYTYLPMIVLYMLAGWAIASIRMPTGHGRAAFKVLVAAVLILLGASTHRYKDIWRSDLALWQHVDERYPGLSSKAQNNLGNSYFEAGRYHQAELEYRRGIAIEPKDLTLYSNLGVTLVKLGENDKALAAYALLVANNPESIWGYVEAATAHSRQGQYKSALGYYSQALQRDANHPETLVGIGETLLLLGDAQQAIAFLGRVPADSAEHYPAQLLLSQAYLISDTRRASEILERLEQRFGPAREIEQIRARLHHQRAVDEAGQPRRGVNPSTRR